MQNRLAVGNAVHISRLEMIVGFKVKVRDI